MEELLKLLIGVALIFGSLGAWVLISKAQMAKETEWDRNNRMRIEREQKELAQKREELKKQGIPSCPKCGSTYITAGARGYSVVSGFVGSGKTVNRCANCGHVWAPK